MHEFFAQGFDELDMGGKPAPVQSKPKSQTGHLVCIFCRFVIPQGAEFCPSCGAAKRKAPQRLSERRGDLDHVDTVDGTKRRMPKTLVDYDGDLWAELSAVACSIYPRDVAQGRAHGLRQVQISHRQIPGSSFQLGQPTA